MFSEYVQPEFDEYFKNNSTGILPEILKYSLNGGKCIRSFIVKHIINTLSDNKINFWEPVVSIEMLHSASLIIDDLPCMDNDLERRGKDSTFVKFGERNAILSSFYIVSESFIGEINELDSEILYVAPFQPSPQESYMKNCNILS